MAIALGKKQYTILGKLLASRFPDEAREIVGAYINVSPPETSLSKIETFFLSYCHLNNLEPTEHRGNLYKRNKLDQRRIFLSIMLHLYSPQVFQQPPDSIILAKGFLTEISRVLDSNTAQMSRMVREVITMERVYSDYAEKVKEITSRLTINPTA